MAYYQSTRQKQSALSLFYKRWGFWLTFSVFIVIGCIIALILADIFSKPYRERAESYNLEKINELEVPSLILDRNGKEIGRFFVQNRSVIPYAQIPEQFIHALIAGEDSRFMSHEGIDYMGIARVLLVFLKTADIRQGASTITQQLARNAYDLRTEAIKRNEKGIERKLVEAFLAKRIEERYSKQEILEFYLNRIYFGSGYYGIRSAALGYFGKEPKDLSIEECASIVASIKNPTNISPLNNPKNNKKNRDIVLDRMYDEGMITASELVNLKRLPVTTNPKPLQRGTSHLHERVAEFLNNKMGEGVLAAGGYKIHTSILLEAQEAAHRAVHETLSKIEKDSRYKHTKYGQWVKSNQSPEPDYLQAAVLMKENDTGEVLAYIGSRDYAQVQYDFISQGRRPLGTAFFPFLYAAALQQKITPASVVEDEPMDNRSVMVGGHEGVLAEWGSEVENPQYEGKMTLRRAFEGAKIAAAVRLSSQAGLSTIVDEVNQFGLGIKPSEILPRIAVGWEPVNMQQALAATSVFGRGGKKPNEQLNIVRYVENRQGQMIYRHQIVVAPDQMVMDNAVNWQMHTMMKLKDQAMPNANNLYIGGKGGTTHDFADTWYLGYHSRISCVVWNGFLQNQGAIFPGAFSKDISFPIWQKTMMAALPFFMGNELKMPNSVEEQSICSVSGKRATSFCVISEIDPATGAVHTKPASIKEYFNKKNPPLAFCSVHSGFSESISHSGKVKLDVVQPIMTNPILPEAGPILGDDPFMSVTSNFSKNSKSDSNFNTRGTYLDDFNFNSKEEQITLPKPSGFKIIED